ncbi:MAG: hypothetical protein EBZ48_03555 [Proteobacteria bacterium]|nr:hypothetical protein [Pseudomonadota bacterium]
MTQSIDGKELWRQVPPEEKLELLSRAHTIGVMAMLAFIVAGATLAVGLRHEWFLWGPLIASPLIFQAAAGRTWRAVRPRVMLEYLAARSAARRFAFTAKSKDLSLKLMFRGYISEVFEEDQVQEKLEAAIASTKEAAVWVALFGDAVVVMSERRGGATADFAQPLTDRLEVEVRNPDSAKSDYTAGKEVILSYHSRLLGHRKIRITSKYPAAMVVFEKALGQQMKHAQKQRAEADAIVALPNRSTEDEY